jgi:hypothetical protein
MQSDHSCPAVARGRRGSSSLAETRGRGVMTLLTTKEIAVTIGVTPQRVLAIAAARGVTPAKIIGRNKMWHARDVAKLKPGAPGRPRAIN